MKATRIGLILLLLLLLPLSPQVFELPSILPLDLDPADDKDSDSVTSNGQTLLGREGTGKDELTRGTRVGEGKGSCIRSEEE